MAVCTFVEPCDHQIAGGYVIRYGIGQYVLSGMDAFNERLMAHMKDGRPGLDSEPIVDPGPPIIVTSNHPFM